MWCFTISGFLRSFASTSDGWPLSKNSHVAVGSSRSEPRSLEAEALKMYGSPGPTIRVLPETLTWIEGAVTSWTVSVSVSVGSSLGDPTSGPTAAIRTR